MQLSRLKIVAQTHQLQVSKKLIFFIGYVCVILTLFILIFLFDKYNTSEIYICFRNIERSYSLRIISMEKVNQNYPRKNIQILSERSCLLKRKEKIKFVTNKCDGKPSILRVKKARKKNQNGTKYPGKYIREK